jgi:tyrosyl-tRNA synthetase
MNKENLEKQIEEILTRGVSEVIDKENLKKKLLSGEKLRIKLGIDPTSANIHLGRAVSLLKLRDLQQLGHQIVLIIGDFTGVIGDTSDKESERPMLEKQAVEKNLETYLEQAAKLLDMSKVETHRNSEWLGKLTYNEISEQADIFSLAEFIARDNIKKRLDKGTRISLRELLYPLMQGYDSVMLKADLELGGTDQRFNLLAGRVMQKKYEQRPQDVLMVNLIEGLDGRKMSSSWGNTINLMDDANSMFGKVMSMGDELIIKYFVHCTRISLEEISEIEMRMQNGELNPRDAKLRLAGEIVKIYHSEENARLAREFFINTFSKKEIPTDIPECVVQWCDPLNSWQNIADFIVSAGIATSKSDAKRKIEQGGVSIDGERTVDVRILSPELDDGKVMKVGKRDFVKIVFKK